MAFPFAHKLLAFGGTIFGSEQWSCSLRTTNAFTDSDQGNMDPLLDALTAALTAWWPTGCSSTFATLAWVKFNEVGTDGRYLHSWSNTREIAAPVPGRSGSGATYPPQVSLVATLETGTTRGLASRGRIFWPSPAYQMGTSGVMSAADATNAATRTATLLSSLNAVEGAGNAVVSSRTRDGAQRLITGVTVGRVLDTMRSRRAQLNEDRSAPMAVTASGLSGDF